MMPKPDTMVGGKGRIDTHVHVFGRDGVFAPDRRYAPDYDALPEHLLKQMANAGVSRAVLVQPSFFGTDNSFLLAAIAARPSTFLGTAVVEPDISLDDLASFRRKGIIGVRLNCIGKPVPDFDGSHRLLAQRLADLGMVLQIQAEGRQWCAMEAFLSAPPGAVVIDHFGRTEPDDGNRGFASLVRAASRTNRLLFKFSAPYRLAGDAASACARVILETVGTGRILWGSDWPHTQFEGRQSYADTLGWLAEWVPEAGDRERILQRNPARLFGLAD